MRPARYRLEMINGARLFNRAEGVRITQVAARAVLMDEGEEMGVEQISAAAASTKRSRVESQYETREGEQQCSSLGESTHG